MAEQLTERLLGPHVVVAVQALVGAVGSALADLSSQVMRHLRSLLSPRRPPAITGGPPSSQVDCQPLTLVQEAAHEPSQRQLVIKTVNSGEDNNEHQPAVMMMMDDEENFADESQDEPTITVVNYEEEFQAQFIEDSHNQLSVLDGSFDDELANVSQQEASVNIVDSHMIYSNEADNENTSGQEGLNDQENSTERNQAGPSIVLNPVSTVTRRPTRASASNINNSDATKNSVTGQQLVALQQTSRKRKRSNGRRSGKSTASKRTRVVPAPTVAAAEVDDEENEHSAGQEVPHEQENSTEASNEQDQAGPSIDPNPVSTVTRRSTRAVRKVTLQTGTGKRKLNNNVPVPKRLRVQPAVVEEDDEEASDEEGEEEGTLHLSVTVLHLKCPETGCKTKCPSKKRLNQHLRAKHQIQRFRCRVAGCTASFARQPELTDHRKLAHRKLKNWPCSKCDTVCKEYNVLTNHLLDHHEEGEFACTAHRCNYTDKTRKRVRNHQLKHRDSKYKCTFAGCNLSCYNKTDFTRHLRAHRKEKPFGCGQCNKAFTNKSDLTTHERIHSGLKPYHCKWPGCTYSASDCSNAHGHVRLVHFGLPKSKKEQLRRRIVDDRKASEFIEKVTE